MTRLQVLGLLLVACGAALYVLDRSSCGCAEEPAGFEPIPVD